MKKRNLLYIVLVVFLFQVFVSIGLSVVAGIVIAVLLALPIYFICFVLRLPVWQISPKSRRRRK